MTRTQTWRKYEELRKSEPQLFDNSSDGYEILTSDDAVSCQSDTQDRLTDRGLPAEWGCVGVVFEDQYVRILRDAVRLPTGQDGTYIRIIPAPHLGDGVAILPRCQGRILLLRHYRHATRAWHLEAPRGFGHKDLIPEQNASRELREEIGCQGEKFINLGIM